MSIKVDIMKVYDWMECDFIRATMQKMVFFFPDTWVEWVMRWITSVKYHILLNGQPRGKVVTKGELFQGDLLSFFIFILCTEALLLPFSIVQRLKGR